MKNKRISALLSVLFAGALALSAPMAASAVSSGPTAPVDGISADALGSLTIHKHEKTASNATTEGTGLEQTITDGDPLAGVVFTAQKLTSVDLTTQAGWEKLAAYNNDVAAATADGVGTATESLATDSNGVTTFTDLAVGAYVITETDTPEGVIASAPFIVTIPMTHPTSLDQWIYDVHVYPKNAMTTNPVKTIKDSDKFAAGEKIEYTINNPVPNLPKDQTFEYYVIKDSMDPRLDLQASDVTVSLSNGTVLPAGSYTVEVVDGTRDQLTITFTTDGKALLQAEAAAAAAKTPAELVTVDVALTPTVLEIGTGSGIIGNTSYLFFTDPSVATNGLPSNGDEPDNPSVLSKWGKVEITKTGTDKLSADKYQGAEFQVYNCTVDAGKATVSGSPLNVNGTSTFTTDATGKVVIDGLRNNDWADNAKVDPATWYCLVETKAPAGYELNAEPIEFQILETNSTVDNSFTVGVTVTDVPKNGGFQLPLTGANGVILFVVAGGLAILGAAFLAIKPRLRKAGH